MRRLIVIADDFGQSEAVDSAVVQAHREGIVTEASLMATGASFEHALAVAADASNLALGVHLTLCDGEGLTLGPLPRSPSALLASVARRQLGPSALGREMRAQVERVVAAGIRPTHLSGHMHVHLLPELLGELEALQRNFAIPYLRRPAPRDLLRRPWPRRVGPGTRRLALLGPAALARLRLGPTEARFLGLDESGELTADRLIEMIDDLPEGTSEVMCHPGFGEGDDGVYHRRSELAALCDPRVREALERRGVALMRSDGRPGGAR